MLMMMMVTKNNLPGLFLLLFLVSSTLSGLGSVLVKRFTQIQYFYTWQHAQTFCRRYYTDLAIIYKQSDVDGLNLQPCCSWVNMSRTSTLNICSWPTGGELSFLPWPWWTAGCAFVSYFNRRFYVSDCEDYYFFICHKVENGDHKYTFINQSKTWSDAQQYCNSLYDGLAIVQNNDQLNSAVHLQDFPVWTGLYRDGQTWKWSTGMSDYRNWALNQPGNDSDCVAISSMSKTMTTQNCSARYPFICFKDNLVLVKENKTWEEALEYCKSITSQSNSPHQLVSVQPGDEHSYMMDRVMEADTDEVWTGLRFLAGNWMWINGADMSLSDLPLCPLSGQNCAAFSKNDTGSLETRDCLEKKNFLCYSLW